MWQPSTVSARAADIGIVCLLVAMEGMRGISMLYIFAPDAKRRRQAIGWYTSWMLSLGEGALESLLREKTTQMRPEDS